IVSGKQQKCVPPFIHDRRCHRHTFAPVYPAYLEEAPEFRQNKYVASVVQRPENGVFLGKGENCTNGGLRAEGKAHKAAPGYDVYYLEGEWRGVQIGNGIQWLRVHFTMIEMVMQLMPYVGCFRHIGYIKTTLTYSAEKSIAKTSSLRS